MFIHSCDAADKQANTHNSTMSGLMPDAMQLKRPNSDRPRKKKGRKPVVVVFDAKARAEYLTGFAKRKAERRVNVRFRADDAGWCACGWRSLPVVSVLPEPSPPVWTDFTHTGLPTKGVHSDTREGEGREAQRATGASLSGACA